MVSNSKIDETFKDSEMLELADLERVPVMFSYIDGEEYVFMNTEDYTPYNLNKDVIEDDLLFINDTTEGIQVVIVDDVITTAGSALLSVDRAEEFGCKVVRALGVVDRLQGGAKNFEKRNIPFEALLTIEDFGIEPPAEDA